MPTNVALTRIMDTPICHHGTSVAAMSYSMIMGANIGNCYSPTDSDELGAATTLPMNMMVRITGKVMGMVSC